MNEIEPVQASAMSAQRASALPNGWIDRLFIRLAAIYGTLWLQRWEGVPMADVKDAWHEGLNALYACQIRDAIEHLSKHNPFPPTLPEFFGIAKEMPKPAMPMAESPVVERKSLPMPDYATALGKQKRKGDGRDWAREILALHTQGRYHLVYGIECAKEALQQGTYAEEAP